MKKVSPIKVINLLRLLVLTGIIGLVITTRSDNADMQAKPYTGDFWQVAYQEDEPTVSLDTVIKPNSNERGTEIRYQPVFSIGRLSNVNF